MEELCVKYEIDLEAYKKYDLNLKKEKKIAEQKEKEEQEKIDKQRQVEYEETLQKQAEAKAKFHKKYSRYAKKVFEENYIHHQLIENGLLRYFHKDELIKRQERGKSVAKCISDNLNQSPVKYDENDNSFNMFGVKIITMDLIGDKDLNLKTYEHLKKCFTIEYIMCLSEYGAYD